MTLNFCPFCNHGNPVEAKFCNACGGAVHLAPCPGCGAVNDLASTKCYQCGDPLPGHDTPAGNATSSVAEVTAPGTRQSPRAMIGAAVLAVIAVAGYYGYRQLSPDDSPSSPAPRREGGDRGGIAESGTIGREAVTLEARPAKGDESVPPANAAVSTPDVPLTGPAPSATKPSRGIRRPVESREAKPAEEPIVRPGENDAGKSGGRTPSRQAGCTAAVAALGLCATQPAAGVISRQQPSDAGKGEARESPRQEVCTAAVAALGLCPPSSTQRRE